jgi:hypothetical protein
MNVGDAVRLKSTGEVGIVVKKHRRSVHDGNPNGDFTFEYRWSVLFGNETRTITGRWAAEVIG